MEASSKGEFQFNPVTANVYQVKKFVRSYSPIMNRQGVNQVLKTIEVQPEAYESKQSEISLYNRFMGSNKKGVIKPLRIYKFVDPVKRIDEIGP